MVTACPIRLRGNRDAAILLDDLSHGLKNYGSDAEISLIQWERTAPFAHCLHIRFSSRAIVLPIVRSWPLLDLGPSALARHLDTLRADMCDFSGFLRAGRQSWGERHATAAMMLHAERAPLPIDTLTGDGRGLVEFRLDQNGRHRLWCSPWKGTPFPLSIEDHELDAIMGELPIMLEAEDGEGPDGAPCLNLLPLSEDGGGVLVGMTMPDPLTRMRMIAELRKEPRP